MDTTYRKQNMQHSPQIQMQTLRKLKETEPELWNVAQSALWAFDLRMDFYSILTKIKIQKFNFYLLQVVWEDFQQYDWVTS